VSLATHQWQSIWISLLKQTRQSACPDTVTTPFEEERVNSCLLKHLFLLGVQPEHKKNTKKTWKCSLKTHYKCEVLKISRLAIQNQGLECVGKWGAARVSCWESTALCRELHAEPIPRKFSHLSCAGAETSKKDKWLLSFRWSASYWQPTMSHTCTGIVKELDDSGQYAKSVSSPTNKVFSMISNFCLFLKQSPGQICPMQDRIWQDMAKVK